MNTIIKLNKSQFKSLIKECVSKYLLNESFNDKKLKDEISLHGGLNKNINNDARFHATFDIKNDFSLKDSLFVKYLSKEELDEIPNNKLIKIIKNLLYTNDGGAILINPNALKYDDYNNKNKVRDLKYIESDPKYKEWYESDYKNNKNDAINNVRTYRKLTNYVSNMPR